MEIVILYIYMKNKTLLKYRYIFRQVKNRLLAKLFYKFLGGKSFFLNEITILLTYACNLSCVMCPQYGKHGLVGSDFDAKEKCEEDVLKKFIDDVSCFSPSIITLSGGEPFLYSNWYSIAEYIKKKNIKTCLITNGILIDKFIPEIIDSIDVLHISIDGLGDTHNKIRRKDGVFEKVIYNIKKLQSRSFASPEIMIAYTFSQDNFSNISDFILYFKEQNIKIEKFIFQHLMFLDEKLSDEHKKIFFEKFNINSNFWDGFLFKPEGINLETHWEEICNVKKKFKNVIFKPNFRNFQELKAYYRGDTFLKNRCISPYLSLTLLPQGDLWICPAYSIGNIKEENFSKLWNKDSAKKFRKYTTKNIFPACRACCYLYEY